MFLWYITVVARIQAVAQTLRVPQFPITLLLQASKPDSNLQNEFTKVKQDTRIVQLNPSTSCLNGVNHSRQAKSYI